MSPSPPKVAPRRRSCRRGGLRRSRDRGTRPRGARQAEPASSRGRTSSSAGVVQDDDRRPEGRRGEQVLHVAEDATAVGRRRRARSRRSAPRPEPLEEGRRAWLSRVWVVTIGSSRVRPSGCTRSKEWISRSGGRGSACSRPPRCRSRSRGGSAGPAGLPGPRARRASTARGRGRAGRPGERGPPSRVGATPLPPQGGPLHEPPGQLGTAAEARSVRGRRTASATLSPPGRARPGTAPPSRPRATGSRVRALSDPGEHRVSSQCHVRPVRASSITGPQSRPVTASADSRFAPHAVVLPHRPVASASARPPAKAPAASALARGLRGAAHSRRGPWRARART